MQCVLITGAGSGFGAAVALRLAGHSKHLILHTGSNADGLHRVEAACQAAGTTVDLIIGDLCDAGTVKRLVAAGREVWSDEAKFFDSATSNKWEGVLSSDDLAAYDRVMSERLLPEARGWLEWGSAGVNPGSRG